MTLVELANGFCCGVSPRWFEGLLWFSDMIGESVHTVDLKGSITALPVSGHRPFGLGFRPDGSLLIASADSRQLLCYDGEEIFVVAELSEAVDTDLGDMVVDHSGRAYIGSQTSQGGVILRADPDRNVAVVADDLENPSGMAISADGKRLIVAESTGRRLTAYTVYPDGSLSDRRIFADGLDGPPAGIALDVDDGVWVSMTLANRFERLVEGGSVTNRIETADQVATACALGGPQRKTLFLLTSTDAQGHKPSGAKVSRVRATIVDIPGSGLP
ncbi:SMP-30/gluconolactonase/LRE family protein [Mycobacterium palustre]|uniref:Gluconolactonase n=1 Tax=Mycobacterium palustre TaxID=153971 RepID=A0A1X1ZLX5_9MYCO|nr:SMP-30/gluconolactonase/LRE family protein [Mycobacterium palustre]MCV7102267.1 SMP-30/gluconolactonase/LRE family protein [Mycobacterium palustre]ORW24333.1 gluconolactonase [Mycobacterium palustre]